MLPCECRERWECCLCQGYRHRLKFDGEEASAVLTGLYTGLLHM